MLVLIWGVTLLGSGAILGAAAVYGEISEASISNHSVEMIRWESQLETKFKMRQSA